MSKTAIPAAATGLPEIMPRRPFLAGLVTAAAVLAVTTTDTRSQVSENPDPIFSLIERHTIARAMLNEVDYADDDPIWDERNEAEYTAWNDFTRSPVTTMLGAIAFIEHLTKWIDNTDCGSCDCARVVLDRFAVSLKRIGGAS